MINFKNIEALLLIKNKKMNAINLNYVENEYELLFMNNLKK